MIAPAALLGYRTSGAVLTLVLPLGLFIVVMIVVYLVFSQRRTVRSDTPADDADTAVIGTAIGESPVDETE